MLDYKEYIADWPDMPNPNFIHWLDEITTKWQDKTAILYRSGKQKEFTTWSFRHYAEECRRIGRGLLAAGLRKGDRVALWAENRPEWMVVWMGTIIAGGVIVPIDFLVSENECANILRITRAKAFFYASRKREFAKSLGSRGISVDTPICLDGEGPDSWAAFGSDAGDRQLPGVSEIAEHDPVSIVFTSGTTGFAKGVTLSHKGIIANTSAAVRSLRADDRDVFINVLPLHHTYPTTCSFIAPLSVGAAVIIVEKLVGKVVVDDIRDGGGTFLIAVPLLYDKVKAAIEQGYNKLPGALRIVLDIFRNIALDQAKKGNYRFGQVFFRFIRKKASLASIRLMVAGGGPLSPKTADFFDSLGFNIVHGYGMSENSPLISVNTPWHKRNESVGLPVKYTDVKIIDVNEEGIGEIAVKSPSIMLGYYENPEATREIITENGYLLTGDLGYRDDDGFIFINGRKKNLIVSSGGKNIYPEEIEAHFDGSRVIGEILVLGRKEAEFGGEQIFAVVVPNMETLAEDYPGKTLEESFIHDLVKKEIEQVNRTLVGYKKITDFILRQEEFEKNAQRKIKRFLYKSYETPPSSAPAR
ncbi:MAG: AMP-binding protein [Spirochaetaceae bacterium]|jgi:long-chain acyl-CoA synthetase|nr:AMP-binding protein [Spirochaetaceae bacterium]